MHISEGVLSGPVLLSGAALAAAGTIDTLWTRLYNGDSADQFNMTADMKVDQAHNRVYVCGSGEAPQWPSVSAQYRIHRTKPPTIIEITHGE